MHNYLKILILIIFQGLLSACGGGGSSAAPAIVAIPESVEEIDYSELELFVNLFSVEDMALIIGDDTGVLYTYEKGNFTINDPLLIASANKWLTGATIWRLIEKGIIDRSDNPQDFIDFWTTDLADPRSGITLDNFLGLTSGFNNSPVKPQCVNLKAFTLYECVQFLYEGGLDSHPGTALYYGPEHFQMAALMASEAEDGKDFRDIMRDELFDPVGMSEVTAYPIASGDNVRYSGSIISTANDYAKFLQSILKGDFFSDLEGFIEDRSSNVVFGSRPDTVDAIGLDWHYAFGFWKECDTTPYSASCNNNAVISSPGAFGFTPWVDLENNYWGIIAFEGNDNVPGFRSGMESVELEQQIQTIIEKLF